MLTGFSHAELVSLLWPIQAIVPNQITTGTAKDTYAADPQPAVGIDTWDAGGSLFSNCLVLVSVYEATAGTLTISLRDSKDAITTANGAASTKEVCSLATIAAVGLYYAELMFTHVFPDDIARSVADADNIATRRYHSFRGAAAGGTFSFGVIALYGFTSRNYPVQKATKLAITWAAA